MRAPGSLAELNAVGFCSRADSQDYCFSLFRCILVRVVFLVDECPGDSNVLIRVDRIFMMGGIGKSDVAIFF